MSLLTKATSFFQSGLSSSQAVPTSGSAKGGTTINGVVRGNGNYLNGFRAYGGLDSSEFDPLITGYTHVFMTRPSMNIQSSPYINIIQGSGPLVPIITSLAKGFPTGDFMGQSNQGWENYAGRGISYGSGLEREMFPEFAIEYNDNADFLIGKIHTDWMQYMYDNKMGKRSRSKINFMKNIVDYAVAFFVFSTLPDGRTINFFEKYTGAYPTGISSGNLGLGQKGTHSIATTTINYAATVREIMKLSILQDFVEVSSNKASTDILSGAALANRPFYNMASAPPLVMEDLNFRSFSRVGIARGKNGRLQLVYS